MTSVEHSAKLGHFLDDLARRPPPRVQPPPSPPLDPSEPILGEFLRSMLTWEASAAKAAAALKRVEAAVVDFNELRVCLPEELVAILGERYPRTVERAQRLRAALHELYIRNHSVSLEFLAGMPKREAYVYLESLDGVPTFVAARVHLLCLGGHSAPVDSRIAVAMAEAGLIECGMSAETVAGIVERRIRAGELEPVYLHLQAWADEAPGIESRTGRGGSGGGGGSSPRTQGRSPRGHAGRNGGRD